MTYSGENYQLHLGDSARVLATFPADSIDLTVTSPPYDNLRDYGKDFYPNSFNWQTVISELYRVTKPGGVVVWVVGDATINGSESGTSFRQALYAMGVGFNLHNTIIWAKGGFTSPQSTRYPKTFEYVFVWSKGKPKTVNLIKDRKNKKQGEWNAGTRRQKNGETIPRGRNYRQSENGVRFDVWDISPETSGLKRDHPAQFPESLARDHIISWSNEGDTVLDCFLGSGTTGKMAMIHKRKFIGIELDPDYLDIAHTRIKNAVGQIALTRSEAKKGKQLLPIFGIE